MAARDYPTTETADREIVITRRFTAPRELVWRAWTEPDHLIKWWGPDGFTNTFHEVDFRTGGVWRFIMHGPDGVDYHNKIVYLEVAKPERLVYEHAGEGDTEDVRFRTTVTFAEEGGKTRLTMRAVFESAAARERAVKEHGAVEGGKQTLERLAEYLAQA